MSKLQQCIIEVEKTTLVHHVEKAIAVVQSPYQEIAIVDTQGLGRAVFIDGVAQSAQMDEHIYHESLVHPAMVAHPNPQSVFIAGGGEGAILREILKHNTVNQVIMADLDEAMVNLAKEHLESWHQGAFADPRVELVFADAKAHLASLSQTFDVFIMDLPDPLEDSPVAQFYEHPFFEFVKSKLSANGVFVAQAGVTDFGEHETYCSIVKAIRQVFQHTLPYQTAIPFFRSSWGFILAGNNPFDTRFAETDNILAQRECSPLKFYDAETHRHIFSLPKHLRDSYQSTCQ